MAMACLRLVTFLPLRPLFSLPCFIAFISRSTLLPAAFPYLRPELLLFAEVFLLALFLLALFLLALFFVALFLAAVFLLAIFLVADFFLVPDFFAAAFFVAIRILPDSRSPEPLSQVASQGDVSLRVILPRSPADRKSVV